MFKNHITEELEEVIVKDEITDVGNSSQLIVYNDDFNTFEWVIECFVDILKHSGAQSEQLALIIHYKGQATVKTASQKILRPFKDALVDRGLSAVIESCGK